MIQSMTGFGKHIVQLPKKKITAELKSLNSKSLDISARIPPAYRETELELRKKIADILIRGKIDFTLYVEPTGDETLGQVNAPVIRNYMAQFRDIADGDDLSLMEMALRMPDALKTDRSEVDETEYVAIAEAVDHALIELTSFRATEGQCLENDFKMRVDTLTCLLKAVESVDPERQTTIRERLNKAVDDLGTTVDENRFEQELIYYLEKYDITEEKVRLANHMHYFLESLGSADSNGKKLGFITQEMGREINTIGSKANYAPMQQLVVQMKDELEKIKEQILNVL